MPLVAAAGIFLGFPTNIDHQDMASRGVTDQKTRWLAHILEAPGETIFASAHAMGRSSPFDARSANAVLEPAVFRKSAKIRLNTKVKTKRTGQKINRALKGKRVVSASIVKPPVHFSAGSVLQRQSLLQALNPGARIELAFVKPKPQNEALQIASLFHPPKSNKEDAFANLPVMVASLVKESESSVFAYAPEPKLERSPFAAVLEPEQPVTLTPRLGKGDHAWAAGALPKRAFSKREQLCLAQGVYFEARGESVRGQAAVSQVILNRVRNPSYPNSICGVVYQNKNRRNRCQFSFACDRIRDRVRDRKSWEIAQHIASETTAGRIWFPQVGSSTHYHATYVKPKWARAMKRVGRIGLHVFYRTKRGGWS